MWINSSARGVSMSGTQDPQPNQKSVLPVKAGGGRKRNPLTYERVRELFDYHEDGYLVRRVTVSNNARVEQQAGNKRKDGYWIVRVDGHNFLQHRVIWLLHHGYLPEHIVDHINGDPSNNRISNLREASQACNLINKKLSPKSVSGVAGVTFPKREKRWRVDITLPNGKKKALGYYTDLTKAVWARYNAERELNNYDYLADSTAKRYLEERGLL